MAYREEISLDKLPKGVTDDQLNQECDDAILTDIARHIQHHDYGKYGLKLGVDEDTIHEFERDPQVSTAAAIFKDWHRREQNNATYKKLVLVALELNDEAGLKKICQMCSKEGTSAASWLESPYQKIPAYEVHPRGSLWCDTSTSTEIIVHLSPLGITVERPNLLWDMTKTKELKIHFLNPEILQIEEWKCGEDGPLTTKQILNWVDSGWNKEGQKYPKLLKMEATQEEAHIRVKFEKSRPSWSIIGQRTTTYVEDKDEPTMVLNLYHMTTAAEQSSMVLHQFGHALGLDHEHQRSQFWNILEGKDSESSFIIGKEDMMRGDSGKCVQADEEVFKPNQTPPAGELEDYDPDSIMHYWFDINWLKPELRDPVHVEQTKDLTDSQRLVIKGVHARDYRYGKLPEKPSLHDFKMLDAAYDTPQKKCQDCVSCKDNNECPCFAASIPCQEERCHCHLLSKGTCNNPNCRQVVAIVKKSSAS